MYETGRAELPVDVSESLRSLGYTGPLTVAKPPAPQGEIDLRAILKEAQEIVQELERRSGAPFIANRRDELLTLVAEEIQDAIRRGKPETARDRVNRWWSMTGGAQK